MAELTNWTARPRPERALIAGRYVRLEPLEPAHADTLYQAASAKGAEDRFRWLPDPPPDREAFDAWFRNASASSDPLFFAVIDQSTGRVEGRQSLMRIDPTHGVIEIGQIMWGPKMQRTRMATEALFLFAEYVFDLGYRRFEWKCDDQNLPSKRAAERFGFHHEGVFRQHMVVKGLNRDTAWFAMTDGEWPGLKQIYEEWLSPGNFDGEGQQRKALRF